MEKHYGFKKLTIQNILQPDTLGISSNINQDEWLSCASAFLETQLSESVPIETKRLFEVARGTMVYGLLFYPLYSVGTEQLFRVTENALRLKCIGLGMQFKNGKLYFKNMLDRLLNESVIPPDSKQVWECFRELRNMASHPDMQNIITPAIAVKMLNTVVEQINILFDKV